MLNLPKKILVAIDGSPLSDKAAEEAVRMAAGNPSQFKSRIYAVLVLPNAPRNTFTDFVPARPQQLELFLRVTRTIPVRQMVRRART